MTPQQRIQDSGPLSGHVRKGRRYLSPLAATGALQLGDWVRDDLPDLLWPALFLAEHGNEAGVRYARWQKGVQEELKSKIEPRVLAEGLDGRLTSLDRLVGAEPDAAGVIRKHATRLGLLPSSVARALASYPTTERPAAWLVELPWKPPGQAEVELLARAISEILRDGHREALIKCLPIWSAVQAGTFRSDSRTIELLKPYPGDPATRSQADSVIRASWSSMKGLVSSEQPTLFDPSKKWARAFWGVNSVTTGCMRRRDQDSDDSTEPGLTPEAREISPATVPDNGVHLRRLAMDLLSSYVEALESSPSRLYDQERQEVNSGLVMRAGREVITALGAPDLWCMEHGAHIGRMLVEVRIYQEWMARQDPSIYKDYQDYGAGKAKLYARIAAELPEDDVDPSVRDAIDELNRLSRNDDVLDHRIVDTRDSFAEGKSIRSMAEECGLLDLYRHAYSLSSGVAHSEWWSVETHAMERCQNILHRGHLIPSLSLSLGANVALARSWVDQLHALIWRSMALLGTNEGAVDTAFSWLSEGKEAGGVPGEPYPPKPEEFDLSPAVDR